MKQIFITGASTGIGYALTESFLKRGDFVWAGVRKPEVLNDLQAKYPDLLKVLKLDVTSTADIEAAVKGVAEKNFTHPLILINNAGIALGGPIEALPIADWKSLFDVNVLGLVEMTQKLLPVIRATKGRVVNVGSISGLIATPFLAPYCASKFAVRAFSDSLRREMQSFGVKVILLEPGPIATPIWNKSISISQTKFSSEHLKTYASGMAAAESLIEQSAKGAVPVSWVTEAVFKAVDKRNPQPYYLIGKGIRFNAFLARFAPVRLLDALIALTFAAKKK